MKPTFYCFWPKVLSTMSWLNVKFTKWPKSIGKMPIYKYVNFQQNWPQAAIRYRKMKEMAVMNISIKWTPGANTTKSIISLIVKLQIRKFNFLNHLIRNWKVTSAYSLGFEFAFLYCYSHQRKQNVYSIEPRDAQNSSFADWKKVEKNDRFY